MSSITKYGAISSIIDDRTTYTVKNVFETDFLFEVEPLKITENELNKFYEDNGIEYMWFITYNTSIVGPTENDIKYALEQGHIIKIYISCSLFDNYGIIHRVEYDRVQNKYIIKLNQQIKTASVQNGTPLSDELIDIIKTSNNLIQFAGITNYSKVLFTSLIREIKLLKEIVKNQDERIKLLEQK
jgi:hypothetical protein